jgi:hypothetical protein
MIISRPFKSTRIASGCLYTKDAYAAMAGLCAADEAETVAGFRIAPEEE